jgi:hypothetical protein
MSIQSHLLAEYMRTGMIIPLTKDDRKRDVERKLGPPDDWKGRAWGFGWEGSLLADFRESWAWHYGSLCIRFPDESRTEVFLDYSEILKPICFRSPFADLPNRKFTLRELVDMLRTFEIHFEDYRDVRPVDSILVTEGGVAVFTEGGNCAPSARVLYLHPNAR